MENLFTGKMKNSMMLLSYQKKIKKDLSEPPHDETNKMTVRQRRLRASAQSDQSLHWPHEESLGP